MEAQAFSEPMNPDQRPVMVKVGAHHFTIVYEHPIVFQGDQLNGQFDPPSALIKVDDQRPASMMAETLLHEVVHAIASDRRLGLEEHQVDQVAAGLAAVFADNPGFGVALLNAVGGKVDGLSS